MFQRLGQTLKAIMPRRALPIGLVGAATGIAVAVFVSNGAPVAASDCPVNEAAHDAIDAVAQGHLAALQATARGRAFPEIGFEDDTGRPMTLADFEGRTLLVNFWATWCAPCREEMPALDALAGDYGGDDFVVVPINLDLGIEGIERAQAFLDEVGLPNLPLLADPSFDAFEQLKLQGVAVGLPVTLLLDREGCEVAVLQGPAEWDSADGRLVVETLIGL